MYPEVATLSFLHQHGLSWQADISLGTQGPGHSISLGRTLLGISSGQVSDPKKASEVSSSPCPLKLASKVGGLSQHAWALSHLLQNSSFCCVLLCS